MTEEIFKLAIDKCDRLMTDEICKLAVQQNGNVLQFIKPTLRSDEICKLAVQQNGNALQFVINQTSEICKLAVSKDIYALDFVKPELMTKELCKLAKFNILIKLGEFKRRGAYVSHFDMNSDLKEMVYEYKRICLEEKYYKMNKLKDECAKFAIYGLCSLFDKFL